MVTINEIKQQAAAVKNATQVGENTAERVGGALAGLADIAKQHDSKLSDLPKQVDSTSESDLDISDEKGNVLARLIDGHVVTKNFDSRNIKFPIRVEGTKLIIE